MQIWNVDIGNLEDHCNVNPNISLADVLIIFMIHILSANTIQITVSNEENLKLHFVVESKLIWFVWFCW
jgi:hypothetical protein